jgi:hypothetical protein
MGYTHYWYLKDMRAVERALPQVARDLRELLPQLPPLAGYDGEGAPTIEDREIAFNGVAPNDYESFLLTSTPEVYTQTEKGLFGSCKTERHPYDLAVQVALVLLKWHSEAIAPDAVDVASDGNLVDWARACRLVEGLGYPVDPIWVLRRKVWQVKTRAGSVFYIEWSGDGESPEGWLAKLHREGLIPFAPPFSLSGPLAGFPPGKPLWEGAQIYGIGAKWR